MGKIMVGLVALLVIAGILVGIGTLIGGEWGATEAGRDHSVLVAACIDANGGAVTRDQLQACIDAARQQRS